MQPLNFADRLLQRVPCRAWLRLLASAWPRLFKLLDPQPDLRDLGPDRLQPGLLPA